MPEREALRRHFHRWDPGENVSLFSGFVAGLGDARGATNRDSNGQKIPNRSHISWLGAIGYFALLDQIGTCFKPKNRSPVAGHSIIKTLTYFSNLNENERNAMYALRCALAHDFGLININPKNRGLTHRFTVTEGASASLVSLPMRQWDGDYNNLSPDNKTIVNLEALGDLAESICRQVVELSDYDQIEIILSGGSDELLDRYGILMRTKTDGQPPPYALPGANEA